MNRSILHCDMNNFYASVECMLDPSLRKYPVAVCGSVEERHGIVLAKNYAAKAFDVKTGDAVWQAKQKCKDLVVVPPHYEEYIKYSKLARNVYSRYTDQVYVEVRARHLIDGTCRPETIKFENDEIYEIDRVKQCCRAASTKVGGTGLRYTVMICGKETYLFDEENGKWFVEGKSRVAT